MEERYKTMWFPEIETSREHKARIEKTKLVFKKAKILIDQAISEGVKTSLEYEKWKKELNNIRSY